MNKQSAYFYGFLAIALSFVLAAVVVTGTWRTKDSLLEATGSAKKLITSDVGVLKLSLTGRGTTQAEVYTQLKQQKATTLAYFSSKGLKAGDIEEQPISAYEVYETNANGISTNRVIGYTGSQYLQVQSGNVKLIKQLSLDLGDLVNQGVNFSNVYTEFYYSKLADVKVQIQAEAAKDAAKRASEIAAATGRKVGPMVRARMGVLQITPPNSNMVQDYGMNDVSSIEKEITAVVNASFTID